MWVRHNGMVSDHDVKFRSKFWMLLMKKTGNKLKFNTNFHPQTNGQTKKVDGILNQYLHNYIIEDHEDWGDHLGDHLGLAEFCYNSTKHLATKMRS
jgi:translation elongation factor EF-Tu-like GTPase